MAQRRGQEKKIVLKSAQEIDLMRAADGIVADTLLLLADHARPGVTTRELDDLSAAHIRRRGGEPSFPLVKFDGATCISVNNEIVHGIPGARVLQDGDIVSLDVGVVYQGWHGDAALAVPVGTISADAQRLLTVTEHALAIGIAQVRPGGHVYDIGAAIEEYIASEGLGLVRQYVGHGIGRSMWEPPQVPNYRPARDGDGALLQPGMVFAIEPMVNLGADETLALDDGWTVVTKDGSLSAHFEHSIVVTDDGYEILSRPADAARLWGDPTRHGVDGSKGMRKTG